MGVSEYRGTSLGSLSLLSGNPTMAGRALSGDYLRQGGFGEAGGGGGGTRNPKPEPLRKDVDLSGGKVSSLAGTAGAELSHSISPPPS